MHDRDTQFLAGFLCFFFEDKLESWISGEQIYSEESETERELDVVLRGDKFVIVEVKDHSRKLDVEKTEQLVHKLNNFKDAHYTGIVSSSGFSTAALTVCRKNKVRALSLVRIDPNHICSPIKFHKDFVGHEQKWIWIGPPNVSLRFREGTKLPKLTEKAIRKAQVRSEDVRFKSVENGDDLVTYAQKCVRINTRQGLTVLPGTEFTMSVRLSGFESVSMKFGKSWEQLDHIIVSGTQRRIALKSRGDTFALVDEETKLQLAHANSSIFGEHEMIILGGNCHSSDLHYGVVWAEDRRKTRAYKVQFDRQRKVG